MVRKSGSIGRLIPSSFFLFHFSFFICSLDLPPVFYDTVFMEGLPLTKAHLESLTTNDLLGIADDLGVDVPDNPDRVLLIEELLDITSQEDGAPDSGESEMADSVLIESAPLPKHYNITFIEVMIRDPLWAFVFWEIRSSEKEQFEKALDFEGYYLKVSRLDYSIEQSGQGYEKFYTVPVKPDDTAWYLGLSPASPEEAIGSEHCQFRVEFCASLAGVETVLAVSNPVRLPGLPELPSGAGKQGTAEHNCAGGNELVRLSGYGDFHVLRKNERQLRTKGGEKECPKESPNE